MRQGRLFDIKIKQVVLTKFKNRKNGFQKWLRNIFPLANSFAKWKMLGAGRHPTGPEWRKLLHFLFTLVSVIKYPQLEYM